MLFLPFLLLAGAQSALANCKCTPSDSCWPSASTWNALNTTVHGKLLHNEPLGESCYPGGSDYNMQTCQEMSSIASNSTTLADYAISYAYPLVNSCPLINATVTSYPQCNLGTAPTYTINATEAADVAAGIKFAKENNIRLVVKNTGHDIGGRSQGYGSLMIWIKHIQSGLDFHENYTSSTGCPSNWTGSAMTIGGGYVWKDVYAAAAKYNHVVVGGSDPTVGSIGGYLQGGGHGPASHNHGLATDNVLELQVVLASGEAVTANACHNTDLFTALRGGGGGSYGVVISATVKAHPTYPVYAHTLLVFPLTSNLSPLLNVTSKILERYPTLMDAGLSGYGYVASPSFLPASAIAALPKSLQTAKGAYFHTLGKRISSLKDTAAIAQAQNLVNDQLLEVLKPYNGSSVYVVSEWTPYANFDAYHSGTSRASAVGASNILLSSRLLDKPSLSNNEKNINTMVNTVFSDKVNGTLSTDTTVLELMLVAGGQVLHPEPYTSVQPSWRKAYVLLETVGSWGDDLNSDQVQEVKDDITYRKSKAMKALAPGMGSYLNEADPYDPAWKYDFWGKNYNWLKSVKEKYDPDGVFYCHHCVGSEGWEEVTGKEGYGPLCQT